MDLPVARQSADPADGPRPAISHEYRPSYRSTSLPLLEQPRAGHRRSLLPASLYTDGADGVFVGKAGRAKVAARDSSLSS